MRTAGGEVGKHGRSSLWLIKQKQNQSHAWEPNYTLFSGAIVNFDKTNGMELVLKDRRGGSSMTLSRETPLMVRVDNLMRLEEQMTKTGWVSRLATGEISSVHQCADPKSC